MMDYIEYFIFFSGFYDKNLDAPFLALYDLIIYSIQFNSKCYVLKSVFDVHD